MKMRGEVPEGSGERDLVTFRKVLAEKMLGEVPFRCRNIVRFRRVLVQMLCEIPKGSDVFNGTSYISI